MSCGITIYKKCVTTRVLFSLYTDDELSDNHLELRHLNALSTPFFELLLITSSLSMCVGTMHASMLRHTRSHKKEGNYHYGMLGTTLLWVLGNFKDSL